VGVKVFRSYCAKRCASLAARDPELSYYRRAPLLFREYAVQTREASVSLFNEHLSINAASSYVRIVYYFALRVDWSTIRLYRHGHKMRFCKISALVPFTFLLLAVSTNIFHRRLFVVRAEHRSGTIGGRCWREYSFVKQNMKASVSCPSTTLFEVPNSSSENPSFSHKRSVSSDSENLPDVHLFIVESLGQDAMQRNMPMTTKVLRKAQAIFFGNFPGRCCGTRSNLIPLFFGSRGYQLSSDLTLDVNISRIEYEMNALWKIAQRNERAAMYGSTACNVMFGCHRVRTADKFVFHDIRQQWSDFQFSFPYEAFYSNPNNTNCYIFKEYATSDEISRCDTQGPYHHKFFDYYKKFRVAQTTPLFTVTHLLEPHGFFNHDALDYHTSRFIDWITEKKNTFLIFMGDHTNERDVDSTALAIVAPHYLQRVFDPLRLSRNFMIVHEDLHSFTRDILLSVDWRVAVRRLQQKLSANHCDLYSNLQSCFCPDVTGTSVPYVEDMKALVVDFINQQKRNASACLEFNVHDADVEAIHGTNTRDIRASFRKWSDISSHFYR